MAFWNSLEGPDLVALGTNPRTVYLSAHSSIDITDVEYDADENQFYYGDLVVTTLLTTGQRLAFPSYAETGVQKTNLNNYVAKTGDTTSGGSTSVLGLTAEGVSKDVSDIANGIRKFFAGDPNNPSASSDLRKLVYVVVFIGVLYLVWKIVALVKEK